MKEKIQKLKQFVKNYDLELYYAGLIAGSIAASFALVKYAAKLQTQENEVNDEMVDMFALALSHGATIMLKPDGGYSILDGTKS